MEARTTDSWGTELATDLEIQVYSDLMDQVEEIHSIARAIAYGNVLDGLRRLGKVAVRVDELAAAPVRQCIVSDEAIATYKASKNPLPWEAVVEREVRLRSRPDGTVDWGSTNRPL